MRPLLLLTLASLLVLPAAATHTPREGCFTNDAPATGVVQFRVDDDQFYVVDDADGDAAGVHVYEESNGIAAPGDVAHALQREEGHEGHAHPDLPEGCQDPDVVPDLHHL